MTTRPSLKTLWLYIGLILLGSVFGLYLGNAGLKTAEAASDPSAAPAQSAPEAPTAQHVCVPENVAVFTNRIHVRCAIPDGVIRYFALATDDSRHVARTLSLLLTAKASGKRVGVDYNPSDTSGTSIGCLASDCRLIRWVYIVN